MFYAPATRATLLESFNRNFSHFPPVPGEIRPARRGSSIHWHRFRCAGGGRAGVGGGEGISPASPFLLSLSFYRSLHAAEEGVAHREWGRLWPCLLLLFTFSHGDGEEKGARKNSNAASIHRRYQPSSPPPIVATVERRYRHHHSRRNSPLPLPWIKSSERGNPLAFERWRGAHATLDNTSEDEVNSRPSGCIQA